MSVTLTEINGDHCGYETHDVEDLSVDLTHWEHPSCITLKQNDEWIRLTPRMIDDLIEALTKHQERG